jgi:hypothetical protein
MTTYAFIHGSGDGAWAWHLVQRALEQRGTRRSPSRRGSTVARAGPFAVSLAPPATSRREVHHPTVSRWCRRRRSVTGVTPGAAECVNLSRPDELADLLVHLLDRTTLDEET